MDGPAAHLKATRWEIARIAVREGDLFINADTLRFWTRGSTPSRVYYSLISRPAAGGPLKLKWHERFFPKDMVIPRDVRNAMAKLRESARLPVRVATGDMHADQAVEQIAEDGLWHERHKVHQFVSALPAVPDPPHVWEALDERCICVGVLTTRI